MGIPEVIDDFYLRKVAILEDENAAFRADMVDSQHWKQEYVESLRRVAELETALRAVEWSPAGWCYRCGGHEHRGHEDTCTIGNAFRHTTPGK